MWDFEYKGDPFTEDTYLDLRYLNEKTAGESGFIRLSDDKETFLLGSGKPARFWAYNTYVSRKSYEETKTHARFLAKIGVNMVRIHEIITPKQEDAKITDVDGEIIENIFKLVAAMKEQGIYTTISPYWAATGKYANQNYEQWGIKDYADKSGFWGLLFFNETLQEGYKAWVRELYTRINPYTGIPLCDDPAVAVIQIQNEDSLLFWTLNGIQGTQRNILEGKFAKWLSDKYGDMNAAYEKWGNTTLPEDNINENRIGIHNIWEMTQEQNGGIQRRLSDEVEFLGKKMLEFNTAMEKHYRDIGCKQLINANNWRTADFPRLNDIERWSYTNNAVIGLNRYFDGIHIGENNGWRVDPGDFITNVSAVLNPRAIPTNIKQVAGYPHIIPESTWVTPLEYQTEAPLLIAAYQSLTGINIFYWFCTESVTYADNYYFDFVTYPDGQHPMMKWSNAIPGLQGMFPAAALIFREGYIKQAEPVIVEERTLDDLWARKLPVISENESFDPNRDLGSEGRQNDITGGADPLAFLVGPVKVKYNAEKSGAYIAEMSKYIDRESKTIKSVTGELEIDYNNGIFTLNTLCAKGAAGFLSKKDCIDLDDVKIYCANKYMSIIIASMDKLPLTSSRKILIQCGAVFRPSGFETVPHMHTPRENKTYNGEKIINTGKMPWVSEDIDVKVAIKSTNITKWHSLDANGEITQTFGCTTKDGCIELTLPPDSMYIVLE